MCCEVVRTREIPHTDATLERLLASVGSHMACELIGAREPSGAGLNRATIWALARWSFGPFGELGVAFDFEKTTGSLCGTVDGRGFAHFHVVVVEEIIGCCVQELVNARVKFEVRVADERPFHVHCGSGLKIR